MPQNRHFAAATIAAAVFLFLPPAFGAEENPANRLAGLGENAWLKLNPPREALSRAYSGNCFGGGLFWYFGGAHRSYMGNDVELYDPVKNEWQRSEKEWPEQEDINLMASVKAPRKLTTAKGRPWPGHTYQQVCWVPERQVFLMVGRSLTWSFDPHSMTWTCLTGDTAKGLGPTPAYQGSQSAHVVYDPNLKAPLLITTTGTNTVFAFDFEKRAWTPRKKPPLKWSELYSTYIASKKVHLVSGNKAEDGLWLYDAVKDEWKKLEDAPTAVIGTQALAYDAVHDVVLAVPRTEKPAPVRFWVLDVKTMAWSEVPAAEDGPTATALWAPLWFDEAHNVFLYECYETRGPDFEGGKASVWAYRFKKK